MGLGTVISVSTYGLCSFIGVPIAAGGGILGVGGKALDEYDKYTIVMNYEEKQVIFIKTKGDPHIGKEDLK